MFNMEMIRWFIITGLLHNPIDGENYTNWNTESSDECGTTITFQDEQYDIIIRKK